MQSTPIYRLGLRSLYVIRGLLFAQVIWLTPVAWADVSMPSIFGDHMVVQRNEPVPVWGKAEPGEQLTVSFDGQSLSATADESGRWRVTLEPMTAGGPFVLTVAGANTVKFEDVFVGEVWLCSGQSNMEWPVANTLNAEAEITASDRPMIRMYTAKHTLAAEPQDDVEGRWQVCSPDTVGGFSAVGFYFGRQLRDELGVPVGLIHSSWGGSRAEPWTPREALMSHPAYAAQVAVIDKLIAAYRADKEQVDSEYQRALPVYREAVTAWSDQMTHGGQGLVDDWAKNPGEDSAWHAIELPGPWEQAGGSTLAAFDGVVWFRRSVDIPGAWAGHDLAMNLGPIDDIDATYFNGEPVGHIGLDMDWHWAQLRKYVVPGEMVKPGKVTLTVRVADTGGVGGFTGEPEQMTLAPTGDEDAKPISLAGSWTYRVDTPLSKFPPRPTEPADPSGIGATFTSPMAMYNAMLHPIVPYAIRGAIWYQGESNAGEGEAYRVLLPLMIQGWRDAWQKPQMPFGIVQLANYMKPKDQPDESYWAELRDAQLNTFKNDPNTGLAVAIDIGDAFDIHPKNKQEVGRRLALWALAQVYGKDLVWSGPVYKDMRIEEGKVYLSFDHVGGGLQTRGDGPLKGFAVAGEGHKFVWAEAQIIGDEIVVWSDEINEPVAVRYGWADNPDAANLINAEGLPASPFRTDDWKGIGRGL